MTRLPRLLALSLAITAAPAALLAQAQTSPGYTFLEAVKTGEGSEVTSLLEQPGQIVNSRDRSSGETALHIVVRDKNEQWLNFLLYKGANPNISDKGGDTPLMLAVMVDFPDGVTRLLGKGARVDEANSRGETPLIRAVQLRRVGLVRTLIAAGADPERTDSVAGLSARDYALRDGRTNEIVQLLEKVPADGANGEVYGPSF